MSFLVSKALRSGKNLKDPPQLFIQQMRKPNPRWISLLGLPQQNTTDSGDFNNRNFFSHSSGGWKSKIKVPAGLVSSEASLLGSQMATFSLCPHQDFSLCGYIPGVSLCV